MISIRQMRAARGLLNWSQADLAKNCDLSITAVNNIDREHTAPRLDTLKTIRSVLEGQGVEFTTGDGVRMRQDVFNVESFEGPEAFSRFLKDILGTLKREGGEALHILESENDFINNYREIGFQYYQYFIKYRLKEKILISEGEMLKYGPVSTSQYRWIPKELAGQVLSSVYGNKYTLYLPDKIVTIENPDIAETYRKRFHGLWNKSREMPWSVPLFEEDRREDLKKA